MKEEVQSEESNLFGLGEEAGTISKLSLRIKLMKEETVDYQDK